MIWRWESVSWFGLYVIFLASEKSILRHWCCWQKEEYRCDLCFKMGTHTTPQELIYFTLLLFSLSFCNHSTAAFVSLFLQNFMTSQVSNSVSPFFILLFSFTSSNYSFPSINCSLWIVCILIKKTQQIKQLSNVFSFYLKMAFKDFLLMSI